MRYVYNADIYFIKKYYLKNGYLPTAFTVRKFNTELWNAEQNGWMRRAYNNCMNAVADQAVQACERCMKNAKAEGKEYGFPRYKRPSRFNSYAYLSNRTFKVYDVVDKGKKKRYVELGKVNGRIRARNMQKIRGEFKTIRIERKRFGDYYRYCATAVYGPGDDYSKDEINLEYPVLTDVGVDLGLTYTICTSDGDFIENDHTYAKLEKDFAEKQRKHSKSICKAEEDKNHAIVAHSYEKLKNHRKNNVEEISNMIIRNHGRIFMEDLSVKKMIEKTESKGMRKSYGDASWGNLIRRICEKTENTAHKVFFVNPMNTSKTCSVCGNINRDIELKDRVYVCPLCDNVMDRDYNAARNILAVGLAGNPFRAQSDESPIGVPLGTP